MKTIFEGLKNFHGDDKEVDEFKSISCQQISKILGCCKAVSEDDRKYFNKTYLPKQQLAHAINRFNLEDNDNKQQGSREGLIKLKLH